MRAPDILVIGGCAIDYTIRAEQVPSISRSVNGDVFLRDCGGKGLNQSIAAARLGARTALVACVGSDRPGDEVLRALDEDGVGTASIARAPNTPTARTLICVDANAQKQTASYPGANRELDASHVTFELLDGAKVVLAQLEVPFETVEHAARIAARAGIRFVLDAAPAASIPDELVQLADVMTMNGDEAAVLTGLKVRDRESALAAARAVRRRGSDAVSIGTGDGRAVVSEAGETWLPSHEVRRVDTTGAGDACAAGIAVGLAAGLSFLHACELGHAAAALATTALGARASLPFRAAVENLLKHATRT